MRINQSGIKDQVNDILTPLISNKPVNIFINLLNTQFRLIYDKYNKDFCKPC